MSLLSRIWTQSRRLHEKVKGFFFSYFYFSPQTFISFLTSCFHCNSYSEVSSSKAFQGLSSPRTCSTQSSSSPSCTYSSSVFPSSLSHFSFICRRDQPTQL